MQRSECSVPRRRAHPHGSIRFARACHYFVERLRGGDDREIVAVARRRLDQRGVEWGRASNPELGSVEISDDRERARSKAEQLRLGALRVAKRSVVQRDGIGVLGEPELSAGFGHIDRIDQFRVSRGGNRASSAGSVAALSITKSSLQEASAVTVRASPSAIEAYRARPIRLSSGVPGDDPGEVSPGRKRAEREMRVTAEARGAESVGDGLVAKANE